MASVRFIFEIGENAHRTNCRNKSIMDLDCHFQGASECPVWKITHWGNYHKERLPENNSLKLVATLHEPGVDICGIFMFLF